MGVDDLPPGALHMSADKLENVDDFECPYVPKGVPMQNATVLWNEGKEPNRDQTSKFKAMIRRFFSHWPAYCEGFAEYLGLEDPLAAERLIALREGIEAEKGAGCDRVLAAGFGGDLRAHFLEYLRTLVEPDGNLDAAIRAHLKIFKLHGAVETRHFANMNCRRHTFQAAIESLLSDRIADAKGSWAVDELGKYE